MDGKMIGLRQRITGPYGFAGTGVFSIQNIGELLKISNNHDIPGTGQGQHTGCQVHLRSLVHNQIVVDVVNIQRAFDGIGGAENHRVLPIELGGPASKISHLKNLSSIPPGTGCAQFRAEQ